MNNGTYNGWTNRQTWAANLWLNENEAIYREVNYAVRRVVSEDTSEAQIELLFESLAADLLPENAKEEIGDFSEVDWLEIGQMWIDEMEL